MSTLNGPNVVGSWDASRFIARSEEGTARGLARGTQIFIRQLKINLSVPGPTKKNPLLPHSKPGEFPRRILGALRASQHGFPIDAKRLVWRAGSNIEYALALELGLPPHLAARPHLRPTLHQVMQKIIDAVQQAVSGAGG